MSRKNKKKVIAPEVTADTSKKEVNEVSTIQEQPQVCQETPDLSSPYLSDAVKRRNDKLLRIKRGYRGKNPITGEPVYK